MEEDADDKDDSKRKSRNLSEKKRRDQFNALVNDLSALISTSNRKMDKSTVLKSTIAFLKHHNEATNRSKAYEIQQDWKPSFLTNDEFTHLMLESLDGFIVVFNSSGSIYYASESITSLLGYLPSDLLNMSIFDITYELDHECLLNIFLNPKPSIESTQTDITSNNQASFFLHLKRGGIDKADANSYELVKFVGYFRNDVNVDASTSKAKFSEANTPRIPQVNPSLKVDQKLVFVGTGRVQTPQLIREMSTIDPTRNEFTSKHSMEWKFLFLDHRAPPIIGYMPFEVLGTSGYDYYHFDDLDNIVACHEELMQKGEGKSCYYRFLTKGQQWIWLQTEFYISYHQFNSKPDYVVCTHKVVSYADVIRQNKYGCAKDSQMQTSTTKSTESSAKSAQLPLNDFDAPSVPSSNVPFINETPTIQLPSTTKNPFSVNNSPDLNLNEPRNSVVPATSTTSTSTTAAAAAAGTIATANDALDFESIWAGVNNSSALQPQQSSLQLKTSRPGSSYGNISSAGISPNLKRKRYFNTRGNESDSTSMSADSCTSKNSLLTHISSNHQRKIISLSAHHQSSFLNQQHQHQQQPPNMLSQLSNQSMPSLTSFHHQHPHVHSQLHSHHTPHGTITQVTTAPKIIPELPQHPITQPQIIANNSCQYTAQPAFSSLRNTQIVAPTFLEAPQYVTAIPVQPVIAPFPVAPVFSPITTQQDVIQNAAVIQKAAMSPTQVQIQEQLQRKHDELQKLIMQQQDELRIVSEQLLLTRYTLLQPIVSIGSFNNNNTTTSPTTTTNIMAANVGHSGRSYDFSIVNHTNESQYNQYGFSMNSDGQQLPSSQNHANAIVHSQDESQTQQLIHHHNHHHQQHQQQQHGIMHAQQTLGHLSIHTHAQNQSIVSPMHQQQQPPQPQPPSVHQQQAQHQAQVSQSTPPSYLTRNSVPELDHFGHEDIDVLLNLSPMHSIAGSANTINQQLSVNDTNPNNLNNNGISIIPDNNNTAALRQDYVNDADATPDGPPNEDTLLSYMQMAAESSPTLTFAIGGVNDDESDSQNEDTKLLILPQPPDSQHQQQQPNQTFFTQDSFHTTEANSSNNLPNDLEILPYQMSQEQSQNLFKSSSNTSTTEQ